MGQDATIKFPMINKQLTNTQTAKRGFTLIEILIVVTIIGVLVVALLAALNPIEQIRKAADAKRINDLRQYQIALENYSNVNSSIYPVSVAIVNLKTLCTTGSPPPLASYMTGCPTDAQNTYKYVTDASGSTWVLWGKLAAKGAGFWIVCTNGKSGKMIVEPTVATCPLP